ncbi:cold-shock protein [Streptomyces kurssanovii]|uniref:Cold shock domain-containing protein n=1 Tax=Streptomyces kurssanovii TaxID=67312 RepID=A0ABV3HW99_9ACTN
MSLPSSWPARIRDSSTFSQCISGNTRDAPRRVVPPAAYDFAGGVGSRPAPVITGGGGSSGVGHEVFRCDGPREQVARPAGAWRGRVRRGVLLALKARLLWPVVSGRTLCEPPPPSRGSRRGCPVPLGTVKWFDPERGVGLVVPDDGRPDAVAYRSAIHGHGGHSLLVGERVFFDLTRDSAGIRADNICPVSAEAPPDTRSSDGSGPLGLCPAVDEAVGLGAGRDHRAVEA